MKSIEVNELKEFLTCDYIYLPYSEEAINSNISKEVFKCDKIGGYTSPVSGLALGFTKINSLEGEKDVLVIENDFKDKIKQRVPANKDIYKVSDNYIKSCVNLLKKTFALKIHYRNNYDLRDSCILKDYTREILETLNLIDIVYKDADVKIILDKSDFSSYQTLFNFLGTYPNIQVELSSKNKDYEEVSILEVLDIYYKIKNSVQRDFTYITVKTKRTIDIVKVKKYSNLKEVLEFLNVMSSNIIINSEKKIINSNFFLDDKIYQISVI